MPYLIEDSCVACWKCIDACAVNAISEYANEATSTVDILTTYNTPGVKLDNDKCIDCGACAGICPVAAIIKV